MEIYIYTDGSYRSSENMGGWAIFAVSGDNYFLDAKQEQVPNTTNNQMELTALIEGFKLAFSYNYLIDTSFGNITIYSDSAYCINALTQGWIDNWMQNGWRTSRGEEVKNQELMREMYEWHHKCKGIKLEKVKGHDAEIGNEIADALCTKNRRKFEEYFVKGGYQF